MPRLHCSAVRQVKRGLVMGLTGEVNMIDWSCLLLPSPPPPPSSSASSTDKKRECGRELVSLLSSNVSSRTDCTQLFSFIVRLVSGKNLVFIIMKDHNECRNGQNSIIKCEYLEELEVE